MMERRKIVRMHRSGEGQVLITLVHAEGSSYREPGAHLLIGATSAATDQSPYAGTISGGCLEAEVVRKAAWMVRDGAIVESYSTLFDDTAEIPYGLGCGGTVKLLFEPVGTPEFSAMMHALEASLFGKPLTVITRLPDGNIPLARLVLDSDGEIVFSSQHLPDSQIVLMKDTAHSFHEASSVSLYREQLDSPQRLVVLGAGDDAKPLVSMAALLGWSTIVVDGRSQLARPERFPDAERVINLAAGEIAPLNLCPSDAVVLMTHSYEQDRDWLAAVLPIAPVYFGILGARHRSSLLVSEAATKTGIPLATCCERIYAPVGLDLGGDGPEAIALAVIAEAHARCMGRLGASLRLSAEDVLAQIERGGTSRYLQAQCALDAGAGT